LADPRLGRTIVRSKRSTTVKNTADYKLDDAFELYYNVKKSEGMRDRTLADYRTHWRYFREWLDPLYPKVTLRQVTQTIMRQFVVYMTDGHTKYDGVLNRVIEGARLSPTTVGIRMKTLKTMFNFWSKESMIDINPMKNIRPPKQDEDGIETFTDDQLRLLFAAPDIKTFAGMRDRTLMMLLADGGYRINEALRLTTEHLDMKTRCFHLPASMNKNRRPRIVPVSPEVLRELIELISENKMYFDTENLFVSNYGGQLTSDQFRHRLKYHAINAGINGKVRVSPHTFRHYFCKMYLLNGGDLFTLQRIVAHEDITTTRKYVQMGDENIRKQHEKFSPITQLNITRLKKRK
jgi:integrase/recombinase XerD